MGVTQKLSSIEIERLEKSISSLTTKIRKHEGTNKQLARLLARRKELSSTLNRHYMQHRSELLKRATNLVEMQKNPALTPAECQTLRIAEALFRVSTIDDLEYAERTVTRTH